jgi:uracil-DNA glycosylase
MPTSDPAAPPPPPPIPAHLTFTSLREAVQHCHACELWQPATQAVMGAGPAPTQARLMLVGEQPGDREDIEGKPFVGPAGRVLDQGLERAGIARGEAYVTNVVKHFRYPRPWSASAPRRRRRSSAGRCAWGAFAAGRPTPVSPIWSR